MSILIKGMEMPTRGYDTAGNFHFSGTQSGKHIIKAEENT